MATLHEIQQTLLQDIYHGQSNSAVYLNNEKSNSARISIYRNNVLFALNDSLADIYPVTKKIVGASFFKVLANAYIKQHPQTAGNRLQFGAQLAQFLENFEPVKQLVYLKDVATLEWHYLLSSIAEDSASISFNKLALRIAENPNFILDVHPSVYLLEQHFNALDIWQAHQQAEIDNILLLKEKTHLVIWRNTNDDVHFKKISPAACTLITHCQKRATFTQAMQFAVEQIADMSILQQEFAQLMHLDMFAE